METTSLKKIGTNKGNKIMNLVHKKEKGFQWIRKSDGPIYREIWQLLLIFKLRNITDLLKIYYHTSFSPFYTYSLLLMCGPQIIKLQSCKMKLQTFRSVCTLLAHTSGWYSLNSFQWLTSNKYFHLYSAFTEPYRLNFKMILTDEINPLQTDVPQSYM
jgi:hypothetical protein